MIVHVIINARSLQVLVSNSSSQMQAALGMNRVSSHETINGGQPLPIKSNGSIHK